MKLAEELAKIVLGIIESGGYLKPTARADVRLVPDIEAAIAGRIKQNREQLLNFIVFWASRAHIEMETLQGNAMSDWRKCSAPLCESLYRTALEIENELRPEPVSANPILP